MLPTGEWRGASDGQPFAALGSPAFEHDAASRRGHADQEAVRALPAPVVRLKGALHNAPRRSATAVARRPTRTELFILSNAPVMCQRDTARHAPFRVAAHVSGVLHLPASQHGLAMSIHRPAGSPTRDFHRCGNLCGKSPGWAGRAPRKARNKGFWLGPIRAKACRMGVSARVGWFVAWDCAIPAGRGCWEVGTVT